MLDNPGRYRIPLFAGQRVRMVETVVEINGYNIRNLQEQTPL